MSYNRYNYSSPLGTHSYSGSRYVSPSGNSRYSSTSSYDSSRYSSAGTGGLGTSKYGSGLSSSNYSSRSSDYSLPSSYSSLSNKYDLAGSSYTPRSDYTSRYSRPSSSYDSDYGSSKYRSSSDMTSSRPGHKTRFADEDYSFPKSSSKRISDAAKSASSASRSDESVTSKARQRRREKEEGSSPVPPRSADSADVSSVTRKTENLNIDNSSQQSAPKSAGGPKPFAPAGSPARTTQIPHGDGVATKGKSAMNQQAANPDKIPICAKCDTEIRGPFVLALNKSWCPNHFNCSKCDSELVNMGFVELDGSVYCENDYENFFAPKCAKCRQAIIGDTVNALNKTWHPACFVCQECATAISSGAFHVEEGMPYCMKDWQRLFQTKCTGCSYPVEPGDKWIEALNSNWHSECFVCGVCKIQLEGKPFYPRDGKPFCKDHTVA